MGGRRGRAVEGLIASVAGAAVLLFPLLALLLLQAAGPAGQVLAAMEMLLDQDDLAPEQIQNAINGLRPYRGHVPIYVIRKALRQLEAVGKVRSRLVGERRLYSLPAGARERARQWEADRRAGRRWGFW